MHFTPHNGNTCIAQLYSVEMLEILLLFIEKKKMEKLLARNFTHDYTQSARRIEQSLRAQRRKVWDQKWMFNWNQSQLISKVPFGEQRTGL